LKKEKEAGLRRIPLQPAALTHYRWIFFQMSKKIFKYFITISPGGKRPMAAWASCGRQEAAKTIGFCADCRRSLPLEKLPLEAHRKARRDYRLPESVPRSPGGTACRLFTNGCQLRNGERGYCGLRKSLAGRMEPLSPKNTALPPTPRAQVQESLWEAKRFLSRVNIGNLQLL
jgi:hypothetical protein